MHHDVIDLRSFYYGRALGRVVQRALREKLLGAWPLDSVAGMTVAGYGFGVPLLRPYLDAARRTVALMPAAQGVMRWPVTQPNHAVLCDEDAWPLDTGAVDRLLLLHGLETADNPSAVLSEAWRVLGPGGRMQGNLDPVVLFAPWPEVKRRAQAVIDPARSTGWHGHIFNLGHGILPQTPVDNVRRLVDFIHEYSYAAAGETA